MPKILINEVDLTSPGTPGRYNNYSVLITGYQTNFSAEDTASAKAEIQAYDEAMAKAKEAHENGKVYTGTIPTLSPVAKALKAREAAKDSNGVYELNSVNDFEDIIGFKADTVNKKDIIERKDAKGNITEYHYGARMAYHLLNLGYPVIYKVIDKVADMADEDFWSIFKDKASYDFRFVSHGLLETCYDATKHTAYYTRLEAINDALDKLREIEEKAAKDVETDKDKTIVVRAGITEATVLRST